ncbi:Protein of unknown function [Pyronema omphalodes CBS 100304]|uniref:Uncharacterized protein n=1 Tax=Pyronema omphalodes (strain CBS 100304) TaxID=1076935 RepID=U4KYN8_PYROM|nr:Protein of unknown function [Pyronema omphalodes CBS 100304]
MRTSPPLAADEPYYDHYQFDAKEDGNAICRVLPSFVLVHYFYEPELARFCGDQILTTIPKRFSATPNGHIGRDIEKACGLRFRHGYCPKRIIGHLVFLWTFSTKFAAWCLTGNPKDVQTDFVPGTMITAVFAAMIGMANILNYY